MDTTPENGPVRSQRARARLGLSEALRDQAEMSRAMANTQGDRERAPGWFIKSARMLRVQALRTLRWAVLVELASGASWEDIADAYGLTPEEVRARYGEEWVKFQLEQSEPFPTGDLPNVAPLEAPPGTVPVEELDDWYRRTGGPQAPSNAVSAGLY